MHKTALCDRRLFGSICEDCLAFALLVFPACVAAGDPQYDPGTLGAVGQNLAGAADDVAALIIILAGVMGAIVMLASLYTLWKSTRDDTGKERPIGAVIGMIVGGLLIGVPKIIWMFYNTIMATATP